MSSIRNLFTSEEDPKEVERLALGPEAIQSLTQAIEALAPLMRREDLYLTHKTILEIRNPTTAEAALHLRSALEAVLPIEIRQRIGDRSGLGWNAFFGHVLAVWFNRGCNGFLLVLSELCQFHKIDLQFHWNRGRKIPVKTIRWNAEPMLWGGITGLAIGLVTTQFLHQPAILAALLTAIGIVIGRIYMRVTRKRCCGDPHCATPLKRNQTTCPTCGGEVVAH